jgi:hypothetical protein
MDEQQALAALDHERVGIPVIDARLGLDERPGPVADQL